MMLRSVKVPDDRHDANAIAKANLVAIKLTSMSTVITSYKEVRIFILN